MLAQQPAPVEYTRASEIPETSPWFGWSDQDFAAYERQVHEETEARYAATLSAEPEQRIICQRCGAFANTHFGLCDRCTQDDIDHAAAEELADELPW